MCSYITICLSYLLVDGHLDNFQFGAITNKVVKNSHAQVFVWTDGFVSLG